MERDSGHPGILMWPSDFWKSRHADRVCKVLCYAAGSCADSLTELSTHTCRYQPADPISLRSVLILFPYLRPGLPKFSVQVF